MIRHGSLTPEHTNSRDEAYSRGFDPDSAQHDRVAVEPNPQLLAGLRGQAATIRQIREDDRHWPTCGNHDTRCDRCDERLCALDGPEPRACGTTCVDCPCDCTTCVHVQQDMRADLMHRIEKERG